MARLTRAAGARRAGLAALREIVWSPNPKPKLTGNEPKPGSRHISELTETLSAPPLGFGSSQPCHVTLAPLPRSGSGSQPVSHKLQAPSH